MRAATTRAQAGGGTMTPGEGAGARTEALTLSLPFPPSTNNLFATVPNRGKRGTRRVVTREYAQWRADAWALGLPWPRYSEDKRNRIPWEVTIIARGLSNQRDIDNVIKPTLDLITEHTGLRDNYCTKVTAERGASDVGGVPIADGVYVCVIVRAA